MKKLSLLALVIVLSACKGDTIDGEAIHAQVLLRPEINATCVLFEVRDPTSQVVLKKQWVPRSDNALDVAILRGSLPATVELTARPFRDGTCDAAGEQGDKKPNGLAKSAMATFVMDPVPVTPIQLEAGTDGDGDGYVSSDTGGADCLDSANAVNPAAAEMCSVQEDLNCDGLKGCQASGCGPTACKGPAVTLTMGVAGSSVTAGTCTAGTLGVKDSNGTDTRVSAPTSIGLTTAAGRVAFFSDAACTTSATSVTLTGSADTVTFYFQGRISGSETLTASATGLTAANRTLQVEPGTGNKLVFATTAQSVAARACAQVRFESRDALNNLAPVTAATVVSLEALPAAGFKFYSNSACTAELTSGVTLAVGASSGSFYFKGTQAGAVNVNLTATGFNGAQQTETITAGPPTVMVFTGPATTVAGDCSTPVTVTLKDADGNTANATGATNITIMPNGGSLTYSTGTTCTPTTPTVSIAQGANSATFRYRSTVTGSFSIGGSFGSLTSTPLAVTITPGAPTVLAFTTTAQTVTAGNCSAVATVQQRDALGNAVPVAADTPVSLTANPSTGFQFFTDSACATAAVSSVSIPTGASSASFYFKGTTSGTVAMTATQGSLTANQNATVNAAAPTILAFAPSSLTVLAGDCTQVMLTSTDAFGNRSNVPSNQAITLAPGANMIFSTASNCGSSTTSVTINSGSSSVSFYTRATLVGSVSGTASRSGFTSGTLSLTVNPGAPSKLAFTTSQQTLEANTCSAIATVQVRDSSNNPSPVASNTTVNLSAAPSGSFTFYLNADCTGPTTSITVLSGQTSANFYFRNTIADNVTITASNASLTSATQDETFTSPPPTALVFTTSPQTRTAGACSGLVTVQAQAGGSPATVTAPTPVDLMAAPSTGFTFYASTNCGGQPVTQVTLGAGTSSISFTFKGTTAGTIGLTASNPSIATPATQIATITPAAPTKLAFSTLPLTTVAGVCSQAVTVQSQDASNNPSPVTADKTLTLMGMGTPADTNFKFYSDATCATEISGPPPLTLANGQSAVTFYYKGQKARNVDLSVSTAGLTATTPQTHIITAAAVSKVAFTSTSPAQILASTCAMRTVERQDVFSNPVAGVSTLDVALTGSAPVEFYSDAGCTTSATQVTIAAGSSSANFWFKGLSGGINATAPLTLTATPTGLTAVPQLENIIPTVRTSGTSCTMASNQKQVNCPITPALQDASKAFLVFQATSLNQNSDLGNVRCVLANNPVDVQCERAASGGSNPVNIRWSVAEFPSGITAQHGSYGCMGNVTGLTFPAVVTDHTFLLLSSEKNTANQRSTIPRLVELKSTTTADVRKAPTVDCNGGAEANSGGIVDYAAATVQRGLTSIGGGAANVDINLSPGVPLNQSIVLYSYVFDSNSTKICDRLVRGELTAGGNKLTFSRGSGDTSANCTTPQINQISYEVVTFPAGTVVQQVTRSLLSGTATTNVALSPQVDPSRTIVIAGGQWASGQVHGESKFAGGEDISEGRFRAVVTDPTTLTVSRETASDGATFTVYVVQLKP